MTRHRQPYRCIQTANIIQLKIQQHSICSTLRKLITLKRKTNKYLLFKRMVPLPRSLITAFHDQQGKEILNFTQFISV